jgi:hypothetical protein
VGLVPAFAEELAALVASAFLLGVKQEATKQAKKAGKDLIKEVPKALAKEQARNVKVRRKASAYNKAYAKEYKRLKKIHPRTGFPALAKKAHKATKKAMGTTKGQVRKTARRAYER